MKILVSITGNGVFLRYYFCSYCLLCLAVLSKHRVECSQVKLFGNCLCHSVMTVGGKCACLAWCPQEQYAERGQIYLDRTSHWTFFHSQVQVRMDVMFSSYSICSHQIATNVCTCHDSTSVVACAKTCCDHYRWFWCEENNVFVGVSYGGIMGSEMWRRGEPGMAYFLAWLTWAGCSFLVINGNNVVRITCWLNHIGRLSALLDLHAEKPWVW